jgi:hypothetical protein
MSISNRKPSSFAAAIVACAAAQAARLRPDFFASFNCCCELSSSADGLSSAPGTVALTPTLMLT